MTEPTNSTEMDTIIKETVRRIGDEAIDYNSPCVFFHTTAAGVIREAINRAIAEKDEPTCGSTTPGQQPALSITQRRKEKIMQTLKTNKREHKTERGAGSEFDAAAGYVVAGNGRLEIGKEFEVRNERKGTFRMKITAIAGEWITGTITDGTAKAVMSYNVREKGEEVAVRNCHSYFIPVNHNET